MSVSEGSQALQATDTGDGATPILILWGGGVSRHEVLRPSRRASHGGLPVESVPRCRSAVRRRDGVTMPLARDAQSRVGRHTDASWQPGTPATLAVIIGVSSYPHLDGGTGPIASTTFGLGQLFVSALTAYDMFRWFTTTYQSSAPAAMCWLLVSPTPEEVQEKPELAGLPAATFENCKNAIREWHAAMDQLSPAAARLSRSLFFFSGHGIEVHRNEQILLPSDFLQPPTEAIDDCMMTSYLVGGVATLSVPVHGFFVDACRNDALELRSRDIRGTPILTQPGSAFWNPDNTSPVLYASAPGAQAFQHRSTKGRSLYGTALVEGLSGKGGIDLSCDDTDCDVRVFSLQGMINRRVTELASDVANGSEPVRQRAVFGGAGTIDDFTVTQVPKPARTPGGVTARPTATASRYAFAATNVRWDLAGRDWGTGHDALGSEQLTDLFLETVRVNPLSEPWSPVLLGAAGCRIEHVSRSEDNRSFAIALSLPAAPRGWWMTLPAQPAGGVWAAVLPSELGREIVYLLDVRFEYDSGPGSMRFVSALQTSLAPEDGGTSDWLMQALALHETTDVGATASFVDDMALIQALQDKEESPLGAMIAAHLLLEVGTTRLPAPMLQNLTNWFGDMPDPPVLAAEHAWRSGDETTFAWALEIAASRGLPHLAANMGRLDTHVRMLDEGTVRDVLELALHRALPRLVPGGLFAVFHGPEDVMTPALLTTG
jgi:hypothetical protein